MQTETEELFSQELTELLESKGIASQMPPHTPEALEWMELEDAYKKADDIHNRLTYGSGMNYNSYSTEGEALEALRTREEWLKERAQAVTDSLELTAQMLEAIRTRNLRNLALDSWENQRNWRDSLREVLKEANADHAAKYGEPFARFEKAVAEIAKAGILVKKSRRNLWKIADGVPVLYAPDGWPSHHSSICFQQQSLLVDGEFTAAGKRAISLFEMQSLKVETSTDRREWPIVVRLSSSRAAYSRPEIAELETWLGSRW